MNLIIHNAHMLCRMMYSEPEKLTKRVFLTELAQYHMVNVTMHNNLPKQIIAPAAQLHLPEWSPLLRRKCKNIGCNVRVASFCRCCKKYLCNNVNKNCFTEYHLKIALQSTDTTKSTWNTVCTVLYAHWNIKMSYHCFYFSSYLGTGSKGGGGKICSYVLYTAVQYLYILHCNFVHTVHATGLSKNITVLVLYIYFSYYYHNNIPFVADRLFISPRHSVLKFWFEKVDDIQYMYVDLD